MTKEYLIRFCFAFNCMFYQLLRVQHILPHSPGGVYYHLLSKPEFPGLPSAIIKKQSGIFLCLGVKNLMYSWPLENFGPL